MPNYSYTCLLWPHWHKFDAVRPIGTDITVCPHCGADAERQHVYHTEVRGPTVNTAKMAASFHEALAEREHVYQKVEQREGVTLARPNDWAIPEARAKEKLRRGEVDAKAIARAVKSEAVGGVSL